MTAPVEILLVDDEPVNLDALAAILDDPGYHLLRAGDADRALKLLLEHDVAAIVLDIKMPGVSGFELAQIIKGTKRFREIPILFLTAYMMDEADVATGYVAGAVDYLTKPINPTILRHKIDVFAALFRKTRELAELNETLEARVKERTAELERSETALRAAAVQKDEFLAVLAHELRNPLAPLRLGVDILAKHRPADAPVIVGNTLARMGRQLDHVVRLIDDLMDISRISRGAFELRSAPADLATIVQHAVDTERPFVEGRGHELRVTTPSSVDVFADSVRIAQIVGNLLHNAAKFTTSGGLIHVHLEEEPDAAVIRVSDTGDGIPQDQIDRVFDMFTRIDRPASSGQGLGIGLALARRLAEMHGGTLSAASGGIGHGTTFTLRLPVTDAVARRVKRDTGKHGEAERPGSLEIVVIEDNPDVAETISAWLGEMGHTVRVASNGLDGIAIIQRYGPRLVLCDLGLPDVDGLEVCRRVRASDLAQPRIVAITGWGREEDRARTKEAGFDEHLVKPISPDNLRRVLDAVRAPRATS
jgi:signal transduction histidine kinase